MSEWIFDAEGFEWDHGNVEKIQERHGVEPYECEEAFFNPLFVYEDQKHSQAEKRYYALGITNSGRLIFIVFTIRRNRIRVISARNMSRNERRAYIEKAKENPEL